MEALLRLSDLVALEMKVSESLIHILGSGPLPELEQLLERLHRHVQLMALFMAPANAEMKALDAAEVGPAR